MAIPKVLYVYEDKERDGSTYLVASRDPGELDRGLIGIYDLRETLHVRHALEFRRQDTKQWFKSRRK